MVSRDVGPLIAVSCLPQYGSGGLGRATERTVKSTHGAWSIICDTPAGASAEQCAMMQNVVAEDRPEMGLSVVVLRTADNKAEILRVLAPLGVLLPNGLGLNVTARTSAAPISCAASRTAATPK